MLCVCGDYGLTDKPVLLLIDYSQENNTMRVLQQTIVSEKIDYEKFKQLAVSIAKEHGAEKIYLDGASMEPRTGVITCEDCGRKNSWDAKYCDWCGEHLFINFGKNRFGKKRVVMAGPCEACGEFHTLIHDRCEKCREKQGE